MKKILCVMVMGVFMSIGCDKDDDDDDNNGTNNMDRNFTLMAAMSNYAEVEAGKLADAKAQDDGIEEFGEDMVKDHSNAQAELKEIANRLNLSAPDSLDAAHQALKQQLMSLSGRAFDSVYIHSQVKDHETAISLFTSEINGGQNSRLVKYAREKLPHLQHHYDRAKDLAEQFK